MFINPIIKQSIKKKKEKYPNNIVDLTIFQNYNKHKNIKEIKSIDSYDNISKYPYENENYIKLINEIISYYNEINEGTINENNILLTNDINSAIDIILKTFSNNNSKILIPTPNYQQFIDNVKITNNDVNEFKFYGKDREYYDFINEIKKNDIIYISTPNDPIGYELNLSFINIIKTYPDKLFIIDESFFEYGNNISFYNTQYDNLIILRTFSKAFGLAGIQLGYIIAGEEQINYLKITNGNNSIMNYSINIGLYAMVNKKYYIDLSKSDKKLWNTYYEKIQYNINPDSIIYKYVCNYSPYILLYTKYPQYVCNLFLKNKYLVLDITKEIGKGCIKISINTKSIMEKIYTIIKKINGYFKYNIMYIKLDKAIRKNNKSKPLLGIQYKLNMIRKKCKINILSNDVINYNEIENYLTNNNIVFDELITPFKFYYITKNEYELGYFIRDKKFYLIKYPIINYELFILIDKYKIIHIIEDNDYIDSQELGYVNKFNIPFIGKFIELILNDEYLSDITFNNIGIHTLYIEYNDTDEILMIGDNDNDLQFAINNNIYFKFINKNNDLSNILNIIINIDVTKPQFEFTNTKLCYNFNNGNYKLSSSYESFNTNHSENINSENNLNIDNKNNIDNIENSIFNIILD